MTRGKAFLAICVGVACGVAAYVVHALKNVNEMDLE